MLACPIALTMIDLMNMVRYFFRTFSRFPPARHFGRGHNTGLKSFRTTVFRRFPRTGIPDHFAFVGTVRGLRKSSGKIRCIDNAKKIWWDVRPHPTFGTLEFRVFDVVTPSLDEAVAIAALVQAIVVKLHRLYENKYGFPPLPSRPDRRK